MENTENQKSFSSILNNKINIGISPKQQLKRQLMIALVDMFITGVLFVFSMIVVNNYDYFCIDALTMIDTTPEIIGKLTNTYYLACLITGLLIFCCILLWNKIIPGIKGIFCAKPTACSIFAVGMLVPLVVTIIELIMLFPNIDVNGGGNVKANPMTYQFLTHYFPAVIGIAFACAASVCSLVEVIFMRFSCSTLSSLYEKCESDEIISNMTGKTNKILTNEERIQLIEQAQYNFESSPLVFVNKRLLGKLTYILLVITASVFCISLFFSYTSAFLYLFNIAFANSFVFLLCGNLTCFAYLASNVFLSMSSACEQRSIIPFSDNSFIKLAINCRNLTNTLFGGKEDIGFFGRLIEKSIGKLVPNENLASDMKTVVCYPEELSDVCKSSGHENINAYTVLVIDSTNQEAAKRILYNENDDQIDAVYILGENDNKMKYGKDNITVIVNEKLTEIRPVFDFLLEMLYKHFGYIVFLGMVIGIGISIVSFLPLYDETSTYYVRLVIAFIVNMILSIITLGFSRFLTKKELNTLLD